MQIAEVELSNSRVSPYQRAQCVRRRSGSGRKEIIEMRIRDRDSLAADMLCTLSWCQCRRPRAIAQVSSNCGSGAHKYRWLSLTHRLECL
jgi:hypothetical protein